MTTIFRQICINLFFLGAVFACCVTPSRAQTTWTGNADTNFFNDDNWDGVFGAPDESFEYGLIDSSDVNQVAIIDVGTGIVTLDGVRLGESVGGGNVIQNGGVLNFNASTATEIGGNGTLPSTWIMNNDAVILYDGPLTGGGVGYGLDGLNGEDFDVGNGASIATFELHDTAILRIADDLKISDNGTVAGATVLLDGDAQITAGSGTSIGADGPGALTIAGNALYVSGNSAGPGNTSEGYTNEGYVAMHDADIVVRDNGRLWIRTLQHRGGEANVTIENNGRFDIFDVFFNASPVLGTTTVLGDVNGSERTSELSENTGDRATITIMNNGVMTVDSDVPGSTWSGLALSGGNNRGGNGGGGETLVEVQDLGSFTVEQDFNMTLGTDASATSTLKITGPDTTVAIHGDLRMALDPLDVVNPGSATLYTVITGATHSTIQVGGNINIDNGNLIVELDGFTPIGGESFELIDAGTVTGMAFINQDFTLAPLLDGLSWEVTVNGSLVLLNVLGSTGIPGDFDDDDDVDGNDFLAWQAGFGNGTTRAEGDANGDGVVDSEDLHIWESHFGSGGAEVAAAGVPEPAAIIVAMVSLLVGSTIVHRRRRLTA